MIALTDRQGVTLERVGRRVRVALSPAGLPVMGHLNYLVLSCYVASVSPNATQPSARHPAPLSDVT